MRICVTGGAGFIGSHLVHALAERRHEIVVIDNLASGNAAFVDSRAEIIRCDINDSASVNKFVDSFDIVYHLAAQTDVRFADPDTDYAINVGGSRNIFEAASRSGSHIIFTSSSAVYGECAVPVSEEAEPKPLSQYGWNKLQAEKLCPPEAFIARLFNVYGPRGKSFVNIACESLKKNVPIPIFGTGMQTRDYVHVDNVVGALLMAMNMSGTCNIGTGKAHSMLSVVHMVEMISGKTAKMQFKPGIKGEIENSVADIAKITENGWKPKISLLDGIKQVYRKITAPATPLPDT